MGKSSFLSTLWRGGRWILPLFVLLGGIFFAALWFAAEPPLDGAKHFPSGVLLTDDEGRLLRVGLGPRDQDCRPFYVASTNDWIVQAVIASEDKRFFDHGGVDVWAIFRAAFLNGRAGRILSGASTITMQTTRMIHPHKRSYLQKMLEAIRAVRLERHLTKGEILSQYLNRAPFGSNLIGIEAAAYGWFGKSPQRLHLGEAALLAGMLQAPGRFRPDRHPERAKRRRGYVLGRMEDLGMITSEMRDRAERIPLVLRRAARPFREPYFCDWAQCQLSASNGVFRTTLHTPYQQLLQRCLERASRRSGADFAGVILDVRTRCVRAMACTGSYFAKEAGQVNMATAPRSAGSTLKPFLFASAFDCGLLSPQSVLADVPMQYGNETPQNFSSSYLGPVSAHDALVLSLNVPSIELLRGVGLARFHAQLVRLGLNSISRPPEYYGLGLAIGNAPVSLCALANAYATLSAGGRSVPVSGFCADQTIQSDQIFSPGACWMVSEILGGEERSVEAFGHRADVPMPKFGWKTGTSSGFRDAWTIAWNPEFVIGVWCGYKKGTRTHAQLVGIRTAAPVVWKVIRELYPNGVSPWFSRPDTVLDREVCVVSGEDPSPYCSVRKKGQMLRHCTRRKLCPIHQPDGNGGVKEDWPASVRAWREVCGEGMKNGERVPLSILSPADGSTYQWVDSVEQKVIVKTRGGMSESLFYWFCNDQFLCALTAGAPLVWKIQEPGSYRISCQALSGESAEIHIKVETATR